MKPNRPSMTPARRVRVWEREKGVCYLCGQKVKTTELWDVEHVSAWGLSYDDSDENLRVAHKSVCHELKTKSDIKRIAKAKRQAGETGQQARRAKNGPTMKSGPGNWPKGRKIASRGFQKREPK